MMSDKVRESIQVALEQLHDERERIDGAIARLEDFLGNLLTSAAETVAVTERDARVDASDDNAPRDGRLRRGLPIAAKPRSRAGWTDEARAAAAERMRQRWAARREANGGPAVRERSASASVDAGLPTNGVANDSTERGRKGWTAEAREAAAERMRRYWQERRKSGSLSG